MIEKSGERTFDLKNYFIILIFVLLFLVIISWCLFKSPNCGDRTFYDECSLRKPYFCSDGILVERASVCGCPEVLTKKGELCVSKYQTAPKDITLKYVLRGEEKEIDFVVYEGMVNYISNLSKFIYYKEGVEPSRQDFKLRNINEDEQRELLLPLITKIQNLAGNKKEQSRIAVSIVQKIPFGDSGEVVSVGYNKINYSRYPYEVLYDMYGVCGEKSELLAFLLKELGYGVAIFYFPKENHEAVGIKCPFFKDFRDTGYCFIETTGVYEISDYKSLETFNITSIPEIIFISDGMSL